MRLPVVYLIGITWAIYSYSNVFFMFSSYLALKGFSPDRAGLLVGAFYAATTLIRPAGSWVVERAGIRRTLIVAACVCLVAATLNFVTVSFWPLLAIRIAMGCAFGVFLVALTTYQSLIIPEEIRGTAFALITLGALSCLFTVVPLSDWLLSLGKTTPFLAIPVVMAALCIVLSCRLPPLSGALNVTENLEWGTWGELYRDTPFWRTLTSCALFGLCDASIVYLPALILAMGLVPTFFVVGNGLGALAMRTLGYAFFNRHPRYVFAGPSLFVMAVFLFFTTRATSNVWLFAYGFLYGTGMGYGFPAHLALIGDLAPARLRAGMSALVYFCYDISWFVLPVYVGFATPRIGERGAFSILSVICVISGVGVTMMWRAWSKRVKF
ncbi:MAG: MFS transporter [Synergistaceae bacterium]|jgi:MFS family permease|nr:MFS transporter [Synergistaceae bacterium]